MQEHQSKQHQLSNNPKDTTQQSATSNSIQRKAAPSLQESANSFTKNKTGLPNKLKAGIEQLSGNDMNDVRVHYNSSKPAQLQALAYAQGNQIHLASGQEKHLPHEAWHVVQQKQGRVKPTNQLTGGLAINDNKQLEKEADIMGAKALRHSAHTPNNTQQPTAGNSTSTVVQRQVPTGTGSSTKEVPRTVYQARGGKDIPFYKENYPRSKFSFGAQTRNEVFKKHNPQFIGNRIISIRGNTGEQVNVEGIQLDHQVSWDTISNAMDAHNKSLGNNWTSDTGYSLYDAKMYYNDIDNLVPALGGINASAGALGVDEMPRIHPELETYQGELQTAWMNLQAGLVAVGHGMNDENAIGIAGMLQNITDQMIQVTDEIL